MPVVKVEVSDYVKVEKKKQCIYTLVLSCDPLRVFIFQEGLVRFCTEKYCPPKASNLEVAFMHLTNYAVNKKNDNFVANTGEEEQASKWCFAQLRAHLVDLGYDYNKVWDSMADLIVKSLICIQPILRNNYRSVLPPDNDGFSCFEILGYDVMLDTELKPWLIEVNHSPSFNIDSPLDLAIKEHLITDTIELVRIDPKIISRMRRAEKKAATVRLLEPMQKRKLLNLEGGISSTAGSFSSSSAGGEKGGGLGSGEKGLISMGSGCIDDKENCSNNASATANSNNNGNNDDENNLSNNNNNASSSSTATPHPNVPPSKFNPIFKPRTPEEYEAWRSEILAKRERYESKHCGGYSRIYPSLDLEKQKLYEELLRSSSDLFTSNFLSKARRAIDAIEEKKKKKDDQMTEAQKAEKARQKAYRDR
eukprot:CAMPEP_0175047746 /NCGR_PEP_ID=MMETSP0052_2-20121109/5777_1 /TAXON_ID=51329 ORGANISM="Polytomella parva, Strain SAG 63-3" /NCGR_SAMPLE_ID=MMETSP0052_2 /ASSEMBLY_ACC=CAM_ASM_000194 /LENGTH=420 /DNA_ID=CAMNT_0016311677 /DNA_START=218 /DNA_END=1478 /DNA_ORIENTATION=+